MQKQLIPIYWVQPFEESLGGRGDASLDLGFAISGAGFDCARVSDFGGAGKYAARAVRSAGVAGAISRVRLTVDGASYTAPLTVKMDPRVKTPAVGLAQMFQMQTRLADIFSRSSTALMQARSAREQVEKLSGKASDGLNDAIEALEKKIAILLDGPKDAEAGKNPRRSR